MRSQIGFSCLLIVLGVLLLAGCEGDNSISPQPRYSASEPFQFDISKGARTELTLRGVNGSIDVTGVPGATSISVTGVKEVQAFSPSDARIQLDVLQVKIDSSGTNLIVRTDQPMDSQGRIYTVNYTVTVPDDFHVDLGNVNGSVVVDSVKDSVVVQATNGSIDVDSVEGSTRLGLTNGSIDASVTLPPGGYIVMGLVNGDMGLRIPQNTSALFSGSFANGSITVVGLTLTDVDQTPYALSGTLGTGDGTIVLSTTNGDISVEGF